MSSVIVRTTLAEVRTHTASDLSSHFERWTSYLRQHGAVSLSRHPAWLAILQEGLGHTPYCLEAIEAGQTRGLLPLAYVHSWLFGRYLVSLPYLDSAGLVSDDDASARSLINEAQRLADRLRVKYLELRHEQPVNHPVFTDTSTHKVHMRLPLPRSPGQLWDGLDKKVRNQVRKGQKSSFTVAWGGEDLLPEFYTVFSENMRDLGTPVFPCALFRAILRHLSPQAELCVVRLERRPVAGALLLHGQGVTEVPSASSLRKYNPLAPNMLLFWNLLQRSLERGSTVFDFGRCTPDSNTHRFKANWGAEPHPANWQYYRREGSVTEARRDNPRYEKLIRIWQRLPLWLTRLLGPAIVRGIP